MEDIEDIEERMSLIRECITHKDPLGVKKLILEDKLKDDTKFWELISSLGECVNKDNLQTAPGFLDVCERCLRYVINVGNAKELLLALLEQADSFDDCVKFKTFIDLIQRCILKLTSKQQFSLELALETLADCIAKLELPDNIETDEEIRAEELDPDIENMNTFLTAYLDFLVPFVDQVDLSKLNSLSTTTEDDILNQRKFLTKYLLRLFEHPLSSLDLTAKEGHAGLGVKTNARIRGEQALDLLLKLNRSVYEIVDKSLEHNELIMQRLRSQPNAGTAELEQVSNLALGCVEYLVLVENIVDFGQPGVVWGLGILEMSLPLVLSLLSKPLSAPRKKGVDLLKILLPQYPKMMSYEDLGRPEIFPILGSLFDIMIHSPMKSMRQDCVQLVPRYIQLFQEEGRYQMFMKLFGTLNHAGALGYCVQLLKSQLDELWADKWTGSKSAHVFTGVNLKRLFLLITSLPEGPATDLVENSDRIIAVLNLIRYVVLRDPLKQNMTGFWDFCQEIERDFLEEVQTGLDMAKAHYQVEVTGLEEGKKGKAGGDDDVEMSVSVAGFKLPKMARGQKIAIMKQALNTLDLITSLLVRVNELIDQQGKLQ